VEFPELADRGAALMSRLSQWAADAGVGTGPRSLTASVAAV